MEITMVDRNNFQIKTKTVTVVTGEEMKIGDFVITGPGEYEVGGVSVIGTAHVYVMEVEGLRVAILRRTEEKLAEGELEEMGTVDIVLVPTEGDVKMAVSMAKQLEPSVMIPNNFNPAELLKEMGTAEFNPILKYTITRDKLPTELQVVCLK